MTSFRWPGVGTKCTTLLISSLFPPPHSSLNASISACIIGRVALGPLLVVSSSRRLRTMLCEGLPSPIRIKPSLGSARGILLHVPPLAEDKLMATGSRAFSLAAPILWNPYQWDYKLPSLLAFQKDLGNLCAVESPP